jgi:hypothetical protein
MATPLVGFAEESYQGGSIVMTSKSLPAYYIMFFASLSKRVSSLTSTERGIHQNYFM